MRNWEPVLIAGVPPATPLVQESSSRWRTLRSRLQPLRQGLGFRARTAGRVLLGGLLLAFLEPAVGLLCCGVLIAAQLACDGPEAAVTPRRRHLHAL